MPMTQVGPAPKKKLRQELKSGVQSIKEITRIKKRIPPRAELPESLLAEFIKKINDACDVGELPYTNFRLNQEGSPNKIFAHYMSDTLDPVYADTARKLMQKDKINMDEAVKYLETRFVDVRKRGLAFILTNNAKKFWYDCQEKILYHDWDKRKQLSLEEKSIIARMRKLLQPGNESELLKEFVKA